MGGALWFGVEQGAEFRGVGLGRVACRIHSGFQDGLRDGDGVAARRVATISTYRNKRENAENRLQGQLEKPSHLRLGSALFHFCGLATTTSEIADQSLDSSSRSLSRIMLPFRMRTINTSRFKDFRKNPKVPFMDYSQTYVNSAPSRTKSAPRAHPATWQRLPYVTSSNSWVSIQIPNTASSFRTSSRLHLCASGPGLTPFNRNM